MTRNDENNNNLNNIYVVHPTNVRSFVHLFVEPHIKENARYRCQNFNNNFLVKTNPFFTDIIMWILYFATESFDTSFTASTFCVIRSQPNFCCARPLAVSEINMKYNGVLLILLQPVELLAKYFHCSQTESILEEL